MAASDPPSSTKSEPFAFLKAQIKHDSRENFHRQSDYFPRINAYNSVDSHQPPPSSKLFAKEESIVKIPIVKNISPPKERTSFYPAESNPYLAKPPLKPPVPSSSNSKMHDFRIKT